MEQMESLQRANQQHRLAEWSRRVEACRSSGLPVGQWCQENGIAVSTYFSWQKKVFQALKEAREVTFAEVPIMEHSQLSGHTATALDVIQRSSVMIHLASEGEDLGNGLSILLKVLGLSESDSPMTIIEGALDSLPDGAKDIAKESLDKIVTVVDIMMVIDELGSQSHRIALDRITFDYLNTYQESNGVNLFVSEDIGELIAIMTVVQEYIARDHDYHFEYSYQLNCGGKNPRIDEYWTGPTYYELGYEQSIRKADDYTDYINQRLMKCHHS